MQSPGLGKKHIKQYNKKMTNVIINIYKLGETIHTTSPIGVVNPLRYVHLFSHQTSCKGENI